MKRSQMVSKLAKVLNNSKVANISNNILAEVLLSECLEHGMLPPTFKFLYTGAYINNSDILNDLVEGQGEFSWEPEGSQKATADE